MKTALITGASSGIGRALAMRLTKEGIKLILVARNRPALQEMAETMPNTQFIQADLTKADELQLVSRAIKEHVPDIVINNAGFGLYGEVIKLPFEEQQEIIALNCSALMKLSQEAARAFKEKGKEGVILNISSALSFTACPLAAVYAASKAFVNSFSLALDEEVRVYGVRVLVACPGQVATAFRVRASKGHVEKGEVQGMVLDPEEVAEAIWQQIRKKKSLQIINWKYRLMRIVTRLLPARLVRRHLFNSLKERISKE